MRWTMTMSPNRAQFNLEAENPHEEELCKILSKFNEGQVTVHQGVTVGPCQGGYIREWDRTDKVCAITITKPATLPVQDPQ